MMKKLSVQFFLFFIAGWCCSIFCQQIPVLDLSSAIKHPKEITLNNFVESITYIPLETTYDCLIDKNPKVFVTKEFILTITTYACLVFNRKNGEFIREIGHYGRGPGEYQSTRGLFNDNILAYYFKNQNGDLVKYTMDGVFRGNIRIPGYNDSFNSTSYPMNFSFLNDSVIVCDFLIATGTESNALMIFDEKGKVLKLFPNKNIQDTKQKYTFKTGETSFYHFNDNLFFQNMYNDTVFRIGLNKITPYFILTVVNTALSLNQNGGHSKNNYNQISFSSHNILKINDLSHLIFILEGINFLLCMINLLKYLTYLKTNQELRTILMDS